MTMKVVIKHIARIGNKFFFSIPAYAIRPTPEGIKKNAKWSSRNLLASSIISSFITPQSKQIKSNIIPMILPGSGI
jgi:hypothetical protein